MSKKLKHTTNKLAIIIGSIVLVAFLVFCTLATKGEGMYISNSDADYTIGFLDCKTSNAIDPFFMSDTATDFYHEVKITFLNNGPDKISYNYFGEFPSSGSAETENARMHASYNKYMGKEIDPNILAPIFSSVDNTVSISLYSAVEDLTSATGKFFFLDSDDIIGLGNYGRDDLTSLYESKGFSCKVDG